MWKVSEGRKGGREGRTKGKNSAYRVRNIISCNKIVFILHFQINIKGSCVSPNCSGSNDNMTCYNMTPSKPFCG